MSGLFFCYICPMASINKLRYNILNIARGGLSSDDDRLNVRQIKFWVQYYRAYLIMTYTRQGKDIDPQLLQDLGVLTLTSVDKAEDVSVKWGCQVKKVKIPKLVDLPNQRGLYFVGKVDKTCPFIVTPPNVVGYKQHARFTGNMRRAYMIGEWLYVIDPFNEDLKYINVRGIFDDPQAITIYDDEGNASCIGDDDEYPIPESYVADMTRLIMERELNMTVRSVNDETNDARESNAMINDQKQLNE